MSTALGQLPGQKKPRPRKFWLLAAAAVILLILLLALAPLVVFFLSILALLLGLLALVIGRVRWARIPNRRSAGAVAGGSVALLLASALVFGLGVPTETTEAPVAAGIAAPAAADEPTLASFVGQSCEADHLVMTQGSESNYCDKDASGALVWTDQVKHDRAIAQAKELAEKKAAQEKAAKDKAAAEAKAKAKEAERKAAAAEAKAEQAAAAAEAEREAERQAEAESMVEDTAGSSAYYANCSAVRAAGADPIYSGDPGYSRKLDRDGDGVACE